MRKRKLDPKIIRSGDRVKIINPEVFLRCGYPLCKEDLKDELRKKYRKVIESLLWSARNDKEFVLKAELDTGWINHGISRSEINGYNSIIDILASAQLIAKKFGGNERKIFTQKYDNLKDRIFYVTGKKTVMTGFYVPGSGGISYHDEYDYDPPCLEGSKSHIILSLDLCRKEIDEDFKTKYLHTTAPWIEYQEVRIEAKNVEKLPDDRETIQDENGNWIKNPLYMVATK
jgi:hypothetical protein